MTELTVVVCLAFDHRAPPEGVARFKDCILRCPFVETAMEVTGTFDLIAQGRCSSLAEYTENMDRIRPQLARFVERIDCNFVSRKMELRSPESKKESAMWLPCEGGRRRVETHLIDKIVAEGDYMRIHVGQWSCLVHYTMQRLCERLRDSGFIKLHRSWLVRIDFIDRLIHDERRWVARLRDGTRVVVAKSHVHEVLSLIAGESSKPEVTSSHRNEPVETRPAITEKLTTAAG